MKQKLNVLGLGVDRFFWKKFTDQLQEVISEDQIEFCFDLVKFKWSKFKEIGLDYMNRFKPDFIFTSSGLFKNQQDFDSFFQSYQPSELVDYPNLVLIERKPHQFFKQYLNVHGYSEFTFRQYPGFRVGKSDWFSDGRLTTPLVEIKPLPEIPVDNNELFSDRDGQLGFVLLSDMKSVTWQSRNYKTKEFCSELAQHLQDQNDIKKYKGVLFYNNKAFLSPGFYLRDLVRIETDYMPIDHVIGYREARIMGLDYQVLIQKVVELAKFRSSLHFNESYYGEQGTIKSIIPITVAATSPVICSIYGQILIFEGYQKTVTADLAVDSADRFLINLIGKDESQKPFSHPINLSEEVIQFEGTESLGEEAPLTELEYEDLKDSIKIKKQKTRIEKQLAKLSDQHKVLTSSKIQADKNRYMDMISRTRLELLKNLLEISEIWNEQNCDVAVGSRENVLILYDEEAQAGLIDKQLEHNNRKQFLNAFNKMDSLEALVKLNTDDIEPFLHDGVVICCMTTKALLLRRFRQFEQELAEKKYAPLGEAMERVELEISGNRKRLQRLVFLELCAVVKKNYDDTSPDLFLAAQNYFKKIEKKRYAVNSNGRICIIAEDSEHCHRIKKAVLSTFANFDSVEFHMVCPELDLGTPADLEVSGSALQLSLYFKSVAADLGLQDFDIFVLEGDLMLQSVLVKLLRQAGSKYANTPVVLLASGIFNYDIIKDLSQQRVKVIYQDPYRKGSSEALSRTLKTLFSLH